MPDNKGSLFTLPQSTHDWFGGSGTEIHSYKLYTNITVSTLTSIQCAVRIQLLQLLHSSEHSGCVRFGEAFAPSYDTASLL